MKPWEKYSTISAAPSKPWEKYQSGNVVTAPAQESVTQQVPQNPQQAANPMYSPYWNTPTTDDLIAPAVKGVEAYQGAQKAFRENVPVEEYLKTIAPQPEGQEYAVPLDVQMAQKAAQMARQPIPEGHYGIVEGARQAAMGLLNMPANLNPLVTGWFEDPKETEAYKQSLETQSAIAARQKRDVDQGGGWVHDRLTGASRSLTQMAPFMVLPGGAPVRMAGMIGGGMVQEAADARQTAQELGLNEEQAIRYIVSNALAEGLPPTVFNALGLGGQEAFASGIPKQLMLLLGKGGDDALNAARKIAQDSAKNAFKEAGKVLGRGVAEEVPEELITSVWQTVEQANVDPATAPKSAQDWLAILANTTAEVALSTALLGAPAATNAARQTRRVGLELGGAAEMAQPTPEPQPEPAPTQPTMTPVGETISEGILPRDPAQFVQQPQQPAWTERIAKTLNAEVVPDTQNGMQGHSIKMKHGNIFVTGLDSMNSPENKFNFVISVANEHIQSQDPVKQLAAQAAQNALTLGDAESINIAYQTAIAAGIRATGSTMRFAQGGDKDTLAMVYLANPNADSKVVDHELFHAALPFFLNAREYKLLQNRFKGANGKFDEEAAVVAYLDTIRYHETYGKGLEKYGTAVEKAFNNLHTGFRDFLGGIFGKDFDQISRELYSGVAQARGIQTTPEEQQQRGTSNVQNVPAATEAEPGATEIPTQPETTAPPAQGTEAEISGNVNATGEQGVVADSPADIERLYRQANGYGTVGAWDDSVLAEQAQRVAATARRLRAGGWKSLQELTPKKRGTKEISEHLKFLREQGYSQTAWDKDGNAYHAYKNETVPKGFITDPSVFEQETETDDLSGLTKKQLTEIVKSEQLGIRNTGTTQQYADNIRKRREQKAVEDARRIQRDAEKAAERERTQAQRDSLARYREQQNRTKETIARAGTLLDQAQQPPQGVDVTTDDILAGKTVEDVAGKQPYEMTQEEYNSYWDRNYDSYEKSLEKATLQAKVLAEEKKQPLPSIGGKDMIRKDRSEKHKAAVKLRNGLKSQGREEYYNDARKWDIKQALINGKPVPDAVLADYPDLKPPVKESLLDNYNRIDQKGGGVKFSTIEQQAAKIIEYKYNNKYVANSAEAFAEDVVNKNPPDIYKRFSGNKKKTVITYDARAKFFNGLNLAIGQGRSEQEAIEKYNKKQGDAALLEWRKAVRDVNTDIRMDRAQTEAKRQFPFIPDDILLVLGRDGIIKNAPNDVTYEEQIRRAVYAAARHRYTDYDKMYKGRVPEEEIERMLAELPYSPRVTHEYETDKRKRYKDAVHPQIQRILEAWRGNVDNSIVYSTTDTTPQPVPLPELAKLTVDMLGSQPTIRRKIQALGYFRRVNNVGGIELLADIFIGPDINHAFSKVKPTQEQIEEHKQQQAEKHGISEDDIVIRTRRQKNGWLTTTYKRDHDYAGVVLAHEIGHADDWLPDKDMNRGNLLGRIAKLSHYLKTTLDPSGNPEAALQPEDRKKLRIKAATEAGKDWSWEHEPVAYNKAKKELYKKYVQEEIEARNLYTLKPGIHTELLALAEWWANTKGTGWKPEGKELYAQAISVLLNNPDALQQKAPQFWEAMQNFREKHTPFNELYTQIQKDLHEGLTPEQRYQRDLAMMSRDGDIRNKAIVEREKDKPSRSAWKSTVHMLADVTTYLPTAEARQSVKDINYLVGKLTQFQRDIRDRVVKPLEDANISWEQFGTYLMRRRAAGERQDMANPGLVRGKDAQAILDTMKAELGDNAWDSLELAAKAFTRTRKKHIMPKLRESRLFTEELLEQIENNDDYATFKVVDFFGEENNGWKSGSVNLIKAQHGTAKDIMNPFFETINKDIQLLWAAQMNKSKRIMADQMQQFDSKNIRPAETRWNGQTHAPVPPGKEGWGLVTYAEDGKLKGVYVRSEIADLFQAKGEDAGVLWDGFEFGTSMLKAMFTSNNPLFSLWNIQKDARSTLANIPTKGVVNEAILLPDLTLSYLKTIPDAFKQAFLKQSTPLMRELLENGLVIADRQWTAKDKQAINEYERMQAEFDLSHRKQEHFYQTVSRWIFHDFNQMVEVWSKLAGAEYMKRKGLTDQYDMRDIMRGIVGSPDFLTKGRITRYTNAIFLYSNAQIQGLDAAQRAFRLQPAKYIMRRMMYSLLPTLALAYLQFGDDDDDDEIKDYRDAVRAIPEYEKNRMLCLPISWNGKTVSWFPMPLDHIGELMHTTVWNAIASKDPDWSKRIMSALGGSVPLEPGSINPILGVGFAAFQYMIGQNPYDTFRGRPVIDETIFRAGGFRSAEEFAKWTWNQTAGSTLGRFNYTYSTKPKTGADLPLVSPAMRRFIRTSDRGSFEKDYFEEQATDKARAKILVQAKDFASEFIRNATDPKQATARKAWLEFKDQSPDGYKYTDFKRIYDNLYEKRWPKP